MKLKEYLEKLNALVKEDPKILDFEMVTSADDSGNGFWKVYNEASKGVLEDGDFIDKDSFEDYGYEDGDENIICLN